MKALEKDRTRRYETANGLMNVPEEGMFNWDPGAQFGIYHMDTFYWKM